MSPKVKNILKRKPANRKPSTEMTTAELEAAAQLYEQEFSDDLFRELSPQNKKRWNRVKKKMGRPKIGGGVKVVSVSLEQGLLRKADNLAKKMGISRAGLISRGLTRMIGEGSDLNSSANGRREIK